MNDIVDVAWKVAVALEHVGAPYYLGGSVASSLQATARSTNDIDFVVELTPAQVEPLTRELGDEFDVDQEGLLDAIRTRRTFHLPSGLKIDLMMRKDSCCASTRAGSTRRTSRAGHGPLGWSHSCCAPGRKRARQSLREPCDLLFQGVRQHSLPLQCSRVSG